MLASLYYAKNKLNAVKSKTSIIANSETSSASSRIRRASLNSSTEVISAITLFLTKILTMDVDNIGTDITITSLKTKITSTNVLTYTYTTTQIRTASSSVTSITKIITKVRFHLYIYLYYLFFLCR